MLAPFHPVNGANEAVSVGAMIGSPSIQAPKKKLFHRASHIFSTPRKQPAPTWDTVLRPCEGGHHKPVDLVDGLDVRTGHWYYPAYGASYFDTSIQMVHDP